MAVKWQPQQELAVFRGEHLPGPFDSLASIRPTPHRQQVQDHAIVIALHAFGTDGSQQLYGFVRKAVVAHNVAETNEVLCPQPSCIQDGCGQGLNIGMNIGQNGDNHVLSNP